MIIIIPVFQKSKDREYQNNHRNVYHNKTITAFTQDYNSSNAQGKI